MTKKSFIQHAKPWVLPFAMICGAFFHHWLDYVQFLAPYLIVTMLLLTFCKIDPSRFRISPLTYAVVAFQVVASIIIYFALLPISDTWAQGAMVCFICPTATAAPVITAMLGGSIETLIAISVLSNLVVSVAAPAFFAFAGPVGAIHISFFDAFLKIIQSVGPLIIAPMLVALLLRKIAPKVHNTLASHQSLSFYIWAISLTIVVGKAVSFIITEPADRIPDMIALAGIALVACVIQFIVGRIFGKHFGDPVAGAQGLGQKNTVIAIWMALTYLNPISSIAPAAYIIWQNTINSGQLYFKTKHSTL